MTKHEKYQEHIRYTNNAFCKIVTGYNETGLFLSYLGVDYEVFCMGNSFNCDTFKAMMKTIQVAALLIYNRVVQDFYSQPMVESYIFHRQFVLRKKFS